MLRKNRAFNFLVAVFALGVGGILFPDSAGGTAAAKEDSGQAPMLEFSASEQRYLRQKKRVSMCIDPDWMPYERINEQGRHEGMSADYMALFEKRIGVPIELVPTKSWSESTDFAKARKCDILSMLNKSPERSQYLNFTEPYIQSQSVVVTRDDVTYLNGLKSVGTRSLSVPKGYVFEERIRKDYPNIKLVLVETVREGLNKVSNGEVFAHLGSIFIVVNEIQKNQLSNLKISGHSEYEMNFRIGVRKDDPLLLFVLNKAVGSLSEAEHIRIRRSWTATKLEHGVDYSLLWKVVAGGLALLIAVMFWNRKLAFLNARIRESEKASTHLGRIVEQSHNEIYVFDAETLRFTQVNRSARLNLGYTLDELRYLTPVDIMPAFVQEDFDNLITPLRDGREERIVFETGFGRKDLSTYDAEVYLQLMANETPAVFLAFINDITERNRTEEVLRRSQRLEAVGRLTAGIAHDFNNLLAIILGNLELLLRGTGPGSKNFEYASSALAATRRGADITKKLVGLSGLAPTGVKLVQVNDFIVHMKDLISMSLTPSIHVETRLADDLWPVEIDPGDLEDAILNLALNARDAMPDGGNMTIETTNCVLDENFAKDNQLAKAGDYIMISVSDTGTGMTDEVKANLFEPFFTTKEFGQGSGLGLSMVYGFVQRSAGHIKLYSQPGAGTAFRIYLPRAHGKIDHTETAPARADPPGGSEAILIVDDEIDLLEIAVSYLETLGYRTLTASNGRQAMEILKEHPEVDLLFCDVIMPGDMDGYQVALSAHRSRPGLKILLTSGFTDEYAKHADDEDGYLAGLAGNLLAKPYTYEPLALAVRRALDDGPGDQT